ncbi:hypothetical protein V6Z12_A10G150900 [Gossypium hirsutum]
MVTHLLLLIHTSSVSKALRRQCFCAFRAKPERNGGCYYLMPLYIIGN